VIVAEELTGELFNGGGGRNASYEEVEPPVCSWLSTAGAVEDGVTTKPEAEIRFTAVSATDSLVS
jgi:hypothetical protein